MATQSSCELEERDDFASLNVIRIAPCVKDTPNTDWDGARMRGLRATNYGLRAKSDEARNSRSRDRHKSMMTEMKKETIWNETRRLD